MEDETILYSFVVIGVDTEAFPPRQFSTAFWEIYPEAIAESVAGAVAAAHECLGHGEIKIHILPINA